MMGPHVYENARADAAMHVQLYRLGAPPLADDATSVRVHGRVVRIFRDRNRELHWLQRVSFFVPVIARRRSGSPELSGTIHHDWDRMSRARWLEAFLESYEGGLHLVLSQVLAIQHPTLEPVCGPEAKGFICPGNFHLRPPTEG